MTAIHRHAPAAVVAGALAVILPGPLAAAEKAWLFLADDLPGEATDLAHVAWIQLAGFSLDGSLVPGQPASLALAKGLDRASPRNFAACATGRIFDEVKIDLDAPVGDVALCRLELDEVVLSELSLVGGSAPRESVRLHYRSITYTYHLPDQSQFTFFDLFTGIGDQGSGTGTDTDDDDMPDEWESHHGLAVGIADGTGDLDGDGLSNRDEFFVGSDPGSGSSFFKVTAEPATTPPGQLRLSWNTVPGRRYEVLWSPHLATPFVSQAEITATAETTTYPVTMEGSIGFYRIRLVP